MRRFIFKAAFFSALVGVTLAFSVICIPSLEMQGSLLGVAPFKVARLRTVQPPRVIFVGGSNLSMGLNSCLVEEAFGRSVVNMGLHGGLGLAYMMDEVRPYVAKGDTIILVPEYSQYYSDNFYGNVEVLGVIFDVMPEKRKDIPLKQWIHLSRFLPNYAARKLFNYVRWVFLRKEAGAHPAEQFNVYGDAVGHWQSRDEPVVPVKPIRGFSGLNSSYFDQIEVFVRENQNKGAKVVILPPCFQATSFDNIKPIIEKIESELLRRNLPLATAMSRYRIEDTLCSGTPYHLNKAGVDKRTELLVEDLRFLFMR